jgi:hypothetical protein
LLLERGVGGRVRRPVPRGDLSRAVVVVHVVVGVVVDIWLGRSFGLSIAG